MRPAPYYVVLSVAALGLFYVPGARVFVATVPAGGPRIDVDLRGFRGM